MLVLNLPGAFGSGIVYGEAIYGNDLLLPQTQGLRS